MIKQILCGLLLGLAIVIISFKHDPIIKKMIDEGFKQAFQEALDCNIQCTIDEINFLQPGIALSKVTVTPAHGGTGWKWTAKKYDMYCSWWHLITKGIVNLHVDMDDVVASSEIINGQLAMLPHLQRMAVGDPNVPMSTHYIHLRKATFNAVDLQSDVRSSMTWKSKTIKQGDRLESMITILDGAIIHQLKPYVSDIKGTLVCGVNEVGDPNLMLKGSLSTNINHILNQPLQTELQVDWGCDQGSLRIIHNDRILQLKECNFKTVDDILQMHAALDFEIIQPISPLVSFPLKGSTIIDCFFDQEPQLRAHVNGTFGEHFFDVLLSYKNELFVEHAYLCDMNKKIIVSAYSKDKKIQATADLELFARMFNKYSGINIQAEGMLACQFALNEQLIHCNARMDQGFIRIPETFNGITHAVIKSTFDYAQKKISLLHATIGFNEGTITCNNGTLTFDNKGTIESYYANALIDHVLINMLTSIDLYCSGNIIFNKKLNQNPALQGNIIVDDFQLRQNPLSSSFISKITQINKQSSSIDIALDCDFSITTKKPINIITPWFEAAARAHVQIKNNFALPKISGSICLDEGVLRLPYKPFMIRRCIVTFDPEHSDNPFIELMAQNTIKYHDVSLYLAGPLQHLNVSLLSNPVLTESQIIALLLTGSSYGSLGVMAPSLALYSIKNLLFDIEQSPIRISEYAQEWLKPLRSVHFVPLFDDQRARGGLRGAFEIEVTDRIHALIQKNFTLTEDTRFELEYALSDNISIRAVRDERRDVNGQMEMRWKF